ncbi:hypothetical protein AO053_07780 [Haemophilus influenzae biotype aegyptius]|nr:hypothetical protein AO053_07780 [Haemophilus influenzae biotype aegyptius]TMQ37636.1 hypothetical protein AO051_06245 [Haemophilus influenzae biotype aegyptius]TMQ37735.1 hypothetical protein AO052_07330 [Haemophilus influenzae biotype aegyptius]TMQ46065.1 hypothetical protein AO050_01070 [Haemophilus influenzae biotype aegyptius]TMQ46310.1 hypothetical protein AO049_03300 [Haemophilus influenzae biotype aegyptius]
MASADKIHIVYARSNVIRFYMALKIHFKIKKSNFFEKNCVFSTFLRSLKFIKNVYLRGIIFQIFIVLIFFSLSVFISLQYLANQLRQS